MGYTKETVLEKIDKSFNDLSANQNNAIILINRLIEYAGFKSEEKSEILTLFGVKKYAELLEQQPQYEIYIPDGKKDKAVRKTHHTTTIKEHEMEKLPKNHDRIETLLKALGKDLYEKEEAVRLVLLTAIAGESIFFLGAPGCAKSMIARRIAKAFKSDGDKPVKYFETLLNQFSIPEEVFGNISLKALNGELEDENGNKKEEYRRLTENMLPEADIAFLDEIWKASPAILNTLLTIVNERKFHNGSKVMDVPLKALFAASNELPAKDRGLEALYDRFILRLPIDFIQNEDNFFEMIEQPASSDFELSDEIKNLQISNDDLKNWKTEIDNITLSEEARAVISAIKKELSVQNEVMSEEDTQNGEAFAIGDRRWKKIAHILKTSAFLNDRIEVDLMDCQLIEYCIWSTEKQQKKVREIVEKCIQQNGLDCDTAIEEINEQIEEFEKQVTESWFEEIEEPKTDKIVMVDGQKCYECTRDGTTETWYVTLEKTDPWNNYHAVYNSNKQYYTNSSFIKDGDSIRCNYNFTVKKNPAKTHLEQKEFSDIAQETLQKNFDTEHYMPIVDKIQSEIKALKNKKETDAVPFKANLFADQAFNTTITSKLDKAIDTLEDAKINLDKQHARYFDSELQAEFSIGDVILKNGTVLSTEEIAHITEEQKASALAVICIDGEKTFALGLLEKKMGWSELKDFALHYGETLPKEYSGNWSIPDKDMLNEIWENREEINKSLAAIGKTQLSAQEYWSVSESGALAAIYQLLDEGGKQDHTTKDHHYMARTIREWTKM